MRGFLTCTRRQVYLEWSSQGVRDGQGMWHEEGKRNVYKLLVGGPEGNILLGRQKKVGGCIILKWILESSDGVVGASLIWLMRGTSGGLL
jgi:hypothetical protein